METLLEQNGTVPEEETLGGMSDQEILCTIGEYEVRIRIFLKLINRQNAAIQALQARNEFLEGELNDASSTQAS